MYKYELKKVSSIIIIIILLPLSLGGSAFTPNVVIGIDRRIIIKDPTMLGLPIVRILVSLTPAALFKMIEL
jgi:hypothetical protein